MADAINEHLLEMHFHHAIVTHLAGIYGANFLKILKPSPQNEAWVGFDQGWAHTSMSAEELFEDLRDSISKTATEVDNFYLGYFLQFKKVTAQSRKSKYVPADFSTPFYRSELDLSPNKTTGLSQHETLLRLRDVKNASVSYACAMLFSLSDIYGPASLDDLRCVPLAIAPAGWATNERHFILFRTKNDASPIWLSDPVKAVSFSFREWASPQAEYGPKELTPGEIIELISAAARELAADVPGVESPRAHAQPNLFEGTGPRAAFVRASRDIPESFTLIKFARAREGDLESALAAELAEPLLREK